MEHPNQKELKDALQAQTARTNRDDHEAIALSGRTLNFSSPFEKLYMILKLNQLERPFVEQIFYTFKIMWRVYKQDVKSESLNDLNRNEWFAFL